MDRSDQKARSRARIIEVASRLFRERGYRATSVDDLMAGAGLTRGGFYAHFADKGALLRASLEHAFDEARRQLFDGRLRGLEGERWLRAASRRYLRLGHREHPELGCAIPSLGAEVARVGPEARTAFAGEVERMVAGMAARLGGDDAEARARRTLATWVGAMVLARAVDDEELAERMLDAAHEPSTD